MFVGHYSAALAAKAAEPRAPLWTYVIGCQLLDVGWSTLIMTGAEKVRVDPSLPGSSLVLYHMPWTHSLPAAVVWSLAAALAVRLALKLPWRAAVFVGLAVFSHWLLDLAVHRPDLELWFGDGKVGFGLWNYPVIEQAVEIGLLAVAGAFWVGQRVREGRRAWPAALFLTLLVAVQIVAMLTPPGGGAAQMGIMALAVYLALGVVAWLIDRRPVDAADRLPASAVRA
ncbi:hypothetical protein [Phenylobacterium sp.]|jgi:hypothetical protein|uniref:hypothetical protein n=1 Tax=Phenylobacterium sp. TaxID=1871053 RepID=UPI002E30B4E4|nr:hypothetical protein [Phenylobacterium sp.]HEX4712400.1 hypothetical protein [Phenylobacterium sp.]